MLFERYERFEDCREHLEDDTRSKRTSTSRNADTIANICETVTQDRQWALRMMSDELNINMETIR
jgi:hypothetical protein